VIFGVRGDIADIITHTKFYVDRFRGFGILTRPILPFSIGLAGRPYNRVRTTVLHCDYYGNFHPLQNRHPLTDRQKNCHMRSGRDSYSCAKFGAYPSSGGGFWANGWNVTIINGKNWPVYNPTQCKDDNVICLKRQISFLLVDWQNR